MLRVIILALFTIQIISSCASTPKATNYNHLGNYLLDKREYKEATNAYSESLNSAKTDQEKATAMYGLGRANGYLCNFKESENWFLKAIQLQEQLPDNPNISTWLTQDYLELARLYYDNEFYSQSTVYFEKAIPLVEKLEIEQEDPIGYANVLEDYGVALNKLNRISEHKVITNKIDTLRSQNTGRKAGFEITRFNQGC